MTMSPAGIISTFFGVGFFPGVPGTAASLAAVLLYKLFLWKLGLAGYLGLILVLFAIGVVASDKHSRELNRKDPKRVVIDEVCGQLVVLTLAPVDWVSLFLAFLLFRFLDIAKPFPIKKAENLSGGLGIMADDLVAGIMALVVFRVYIFIS